MKKTEQKNKNPNNIEKRVYANETPTYVPTLQFSVRDSRFQRITSVLPFFLRSPALRWSWLKYQVSKNFSSLLHFTILMWRSWLPVTNKVHVLLLLLTTSSCFGTSGMSLRINIVECYRLYYWNSYHYVSAMAKANGKAMQNSTC